MAVDPLFWFANGAIQRLTTNVLNGIFSVTGLPSATKALMVWWPGQQSTTDADSSTISSRRWMCFDASAALKQCVARHGTKP